jgi:hypothetical protein
MRLNVIQPNQCMVMRLSERLAFNKSCKKVLRSAGRITSTVHGFGQMMHDESDARGCSRLKKTPSPHTIDADQ